MATSLPFQSQNGNYPPSTRRNRPLAGQGRPRCQWCGCKLRGQQKTVCSASHRSQLSRCKHRQMVRTLTAALGIPAPKGELMIKKYSLKAVEAKLNALGWQWQPAARAWVRAGARGRILQEAA